MFIEGRCEGRLGLNRGQMKEPNRNGSKIVIDEKIRYRKRKNCEGCVMNGILETKKGSEEKTKRKSRTGRSEEEEER